MIKIKTWGIEMSLSDVVSAETRDRFVYLLARIIEETSDPKLKLDHCAFYAPFVAEYYVSQLDEKDKKAVSKWIQPREIVAELDCPCGDEDNRELDDQIIKLTSEKINGGALAAEAALETMLELGIISHHDYVKPYQEHVVEPMERAMKDWARIKPIYDKVFSKELKKAGVTT